VQSGIPQSETKENLELLERAKAYIAVGKYEQANKIVDTMLSNAPNSAYAHHCRGYIYSQTNKQDQAIAEYSRALELNSQEADSWHARGESYMATGLYEKAALDYSKALALNPLYYSWYRRSCAYLKQDEFKKAIEDADQSLKINPEFAPSYLNKVVAERKLGMAEAAAADLAKAKASKVDGSYALKERADFLWNEGEPLLAIADLDQLIRLLPTLSYAYFTRARCYLALEKPEQAKVDFVTANRYEPHNDAYSNWLKQAADLEYDLANKAKTPAQQWAIACAALLFAANGHGIHSLAGQAITEANKSAQAKSIDHWWGIRTREDLLAHLENLKNGDGHNGLWQTYVKIKRGEIKPEQAAVLAQDLLNGSYKERIEIVREYDDKLGSRGLSTWDNCRYINLVRWGYLLGFVSEKEAYDLIMPVAAKIQKSCNSWQQMNDEYLIGRKFWSLAQWKHDQENNDRIVKLLLKQKTSPWVTLPWKTNLDN
jgi:tetratricopeptide (TPR) repeat protein